MKKLLNLFLIIPSLLVGQEHIRDLSDTTLIVDNLTVSGTISGQLALEFESVAQMLAYDFSNVADGSRVKCNGYNGVNDGRFGPDLFWNAASTSTADGLAVFNPTTPSGAGRLIRTFDDTINVLWGGAAADNTTDDYSVFNAISNYVAASGQKIVHIPEGQYVLSDRWVITRSIDITCAKTASLRWTTDNPANCGIYLDFADGSDTLFDMSFPQLFSPAINSSFAIPNYSAGAGWAYDLSSRVGSAVHLLGGNRGNIYVHYASGWTDAIKVESSVATTVDNMNFKIGVADFCEKGFNLYSGPTGSLGMSDLTFKSNVLWTKFPIYFDTTYGYVVGADFDVNNATINENGGAVVYSIGTTLRQAKIDVNIGGAGQRSDSVPATTVGLVCPFVAGDQPSGNNHTGTAQAGAATTLTLATTASPIDDAYNGMELSLTGGTGSGQTETISDYDGTTKVATIDTTWGTTPDATTTYSVPIIYDGMGTSPQLGYFGGRHCDITIGGYYDSVVTDLGSASPIPTPGKTIRIRDAGRLNKIRVGYGDYETSGTNTAIDTITSSGEASYNPPDAWVTSTAYTARDSVLESSLYYVCLEDHTSGTFSTDLAAGKWLLVEPAGGAQFAKTVYSRAVLSSLGAGASQTHFIYHQSAGSNGFRPYSIAHKNETAIDNDIELVAYQTGTVNREVRVRVTNRGASPYSGNIYFWLIAE